jgi:hypothetical protein
LITNIATALSVPASSLTRTVAQGLDQTYRQPEGIVESLKASVPGMSEQVPEKLNVFGETSQRTTPWFSPINVSPEQDNQLNQELAKHEVNIGFVENSINNLELNRDELREYQIAAGQAVKQRILTTINSPEYQAVTDAEKKKLIQSAANDAKEDTRKRLIMYSNITQPKPEDTPEQAFRREDLSIVGKYFKDIDGITDDTVRSMVTKAMRMKDADLEVALRMTGFLSSNATLQNKDSQAVLTSRINGNLIRANSGSYDPQMVNQIRQILEPYYAIPNEKEIHERVQTYLNPEEIKLYERILELEKVNNLYEANSILYQNPKLVAAKNAYYQWKRQADAQRNYLRQNPVLVSLIKSLS